MLRLLAELGADVTTPANDGATPAYIAAQEGHANVVRLLASLKPEVVTETIDGWTPLAISADGAHLEATKTLLLLGAPVTIRDLRQYDNAEGDTRQLRADLQSWAADALAQHRAFHDTFLFGCSAYEGITLAMLEGVEEVREKIGAFVGIVVGAELRRLRAVGPAIAAVYCWALHDEEWEGPP